MRGNNTSLVAAILLACSASAWSSGIRTPLLTAVPACDGQTIELFSPLRKQELEFVAEQTLNEVKEDRHSLRRIEIARERPRYLPGSSPHEQAIQLLNEYEQRSIAKLKKCEPLVARYVRGPVATRLAYIPASILDREMLQRLIDNGAVLEAPPIANGKVDNPNSVWKQVLRSAVGSNYLSEVRTADGMNIDVSLKQEALEKFVPFILAHVRYVNTREPDGRNYNSGYTVLHDLARSESPSASYAIRYLITEKNADPKIRNTKGETPLDLYAGKDKEIMALLAGLPSGVKVGNPESAQPSQKAERGADSDATSASLPRGSFPGFITSTLNKGEKINGTLHLAEQGDFEYQGNNGVTLKGRFLQGSGNRITGNGVSQLPKILGISLFKYPDGTTSTALRFNGKATADSLTGTFESPHETGTFVFNLTPDNRLQEK